MLEFLPQELRDGLAAGRRRALRRKSRLHLQVGEAVFPILRIWADGFSVDADLAPGRLRGLVDLYDGPRQLLQCLIVASEIQQDELVCLFKRASPVAERPAADYWLGEQQPAGYLPRP